MDRAQDLLVDFKARRAGWEQAQQLMAAQLAPHFSPFTVYRAKEVDVSRHLALLLDPKGTHGQGNLFWDSWVALVSDALRAQSTATEVWLQSAKVRSVELEHSTAQGRFIDVCVHTTKGVLAIENKPWLWSHDGREQLQDYARHLRAAAGTAPWTLVYLAHAGPSEHSWKEQERTIAAQQGQFVHVPWQSMLDVLKSCLPKIQAPKVRWFVEDLVQMMEGAMGKVDNPQMLHLAGAFSKSPKTLADAFLLRNTLKQWQVEQLLKLKNSLKQELNDNLVWEIYPENPRKSWQRFEIKFEKHPQVRFKFEWDGDGLYEGELFWGLHVPGMKLNTSREILSTFREVCPSWPTINPPDSGWAYWTFIENDAFFKFDLQGEEIFSAHPWLSIDYEGERNFVSLVLRRYEEACKALDDERMRPWLESSAPVV